MNPYLLRNRRLLPRGIVVAVMTLALLTAGITVTLRRVRTLPTGATTNVSMSVMASMPAGFSPIQGVVGDRSGPGVWFWSYSPTSDIIFHEAADGTLSSWPVLSGSSYVGSQARSGMGVGPSGTVWLGVNSTLVALNPTTGAVRTWQIPSPPTNTFAEGFLPPSAQGLSPAVTALAVAPDGEVAIGMTVSRSVEIFNPHSGAFTTVVLPSAGDLPIAVEFAGDGTLAIGYSDLSSGGLANQVLLVSAEGTQSSILLATSGAAWEISAYGASSFVVGSVNPVIVTGAGTMSDVSAPSDIVGPGPAPTPLAALPNGALAGIASSGVIVFPANAASAAMATSQSVIYSPPSVPCGMGGPPAGGLSPPSASTDTVPANSTCAAPQFQLVVTDAVGDIWVVPPAQSGSVALLVADA